MDRDGDVSRINTVTDNLSHSEGRSETTLQPPWIFTGLSRYFTGSRPRREAGKKKKRMCLVSGVHEFPWPTAQLRRFIH